MFAVSPCLSVALLLSAWSFRDFALPPTWGIDVPSVANVTNFVCSGADLGPMDLVYNESTMLLSGRQSLSLECTATFTTSSTLALMTIDVLVPPFVVQTDLVRGPTNATQCEVFNATMVACDAAPQLTNLTLSPASVNWLWNDIFSAVEKTVNEYAPAVLCGVVNDTIVPTLLNHTVDPPLLPPRITPGLTDLGDSMIVTTLLNVLHGLPTLFGFLALRADIASPTSLAVAVDIVSDLDVDEPLSTLGAVSLNIPAGTTLSLELWFKDFVCSGPFSCVVASDDGVVVQNVRMTGAGEVNRLVDNVIGPALASLLTGVVLSIVNASIATETKNGYNFTSIQLNEAVVDGRPPFALAVGLAALFSSVGVAVIGYSAWRHARHPVLGPDGKEIPIRRVVVEDSFVVLTCFATMYLFAWANSTSGAAVYLGETYALYTFSLGNTITDLWTAGLYPLSIFVCIFCGVYTYFKLLAIVIYSVILQQPQSRVLQFIDTCGKFSLLDTFMMVIMVSGLEVQGLATVNMLPSFYVFLVATFLSILVGNYATHGWRKESQRAPRSPMSPAKIVMDTVQSPRYSGLPEVLNEEDESKTPQERRRWRWAAAIPAFAIIVTGSLLAGLEVSLQYDISGLATVVTGSEKRFTMFELFTATSWPICATGLFTVIVAPALYAAGYPKTHVLGAWCATDALLLACVGGLVQLEQFVKFVMGPALSPVYQATATLCWPLLLLLASMLTQWVLIACEIFPELSQLTVWSRCCCSRGDHGVSKAPLLPSPPEVLKPQKGLV